MSSLLFLTLFPCLLAGLVQSTLAYNIESFPSCVEISAVEPQPYSVVQINNHRTKFDITFSKPVKWINQYSKYYVILSSSPARDTARARIPGILPKIVGASVTPEGSGRKWRAQFAINDPLFRLTTKTCPQLKIKLQTRRCSLVWCSYTNCCRCASLAIVTQFAAVFS